METIAHVIPTMDRIDEMLDDSAAHTLHLSVKHGLAFVKKVINKYYSKTDVSNVYRIAMGNVLFVAGVLHMLSRVVFHPQMKLKYFEHQDWEKEWIDMAYEIVRETFKKYMVDNARTAEASYRVSSGVQSLQLWLQMANNDKGGDLFDVPMGPIQASDELDNYLAQAIERVRDPIAWWWDHRAVYPRLSKMAFDYLSIPG